MMTVAKKTDAQALTWMRGVCLALPDTSEGIHYGEIVFKVGNNMFASCGAKQGPRSIAFRVDPARTEQLLARAAGFSRYPYEKTGLVIKAGDVVDWDELRELLEESYRREAAPAAPTAPKKRAPAKKTTKKAARAR